MLGVVVHHPLSQPLRSPGPPPPRIPPPSRHRAAPDTSGHTSPAPRGGQASRRAPHRLPHHPLGPSGEHRRHFVPVPAGELGGVAACPALGDMAAPVLLRGALRSGKGLGAAAGRCRAVVWGGNGVGVGHGRLLWWAVVGREGARGWLRCGDGEVEGGLEEAVSVGVAEVVGEQRWVTGVNVGRCWGDKS